MNGVIVVDKPSGWTSHDVVNKMRGICGTKKIGHLGTLDPMATGVLPLLINRATRLAQFFTTNDKVYEGVIYFGFATDSYDADGAPTSPDDPHSFTEAEVLGMLKNFEGTLRQVPPPVSAKKVGGRKAYELARKNIEVKLEAVEVTIHSLELLSVTGPEIQIRLHCSGGTYVRAIAHELGIQAGCGAHLKQLRRVRSGLFDISQSRALEQLQTLSNEGRLTEAMVPAAELLPEFPIERLDQLTEGQVRQGRDFRVPPFRTAPNAPTVKMVSESGDLIGIAEQRLPNVYHPSVVL